MGICPVSSELCGEGKLEFSVIISSRRQQSRLKEKDKFQRQKLNMTVFYCSEFDMIISNLYLDLKSFSRNTIALVLFSGYLSMKYEHLITHFQIKV